MILTGEVGTTPAIKVTTYKKHVDTICFTICLFITGTVVRTYTGTGRRLTLQDNEYDVFTIRLFISPDLDGHDMFHDMFVH